MKKILRIMAFIRGDCDIMRHVIGILAALLASSGASAQVSPGVSLEGGPGTLISTTPLAGAPAGANAFRIRYRSRGVTGGANEVSGVIILPRGPAPRGGRDVVAWAHGTSGIARSCAPSDSLALFGSIAGLNDMLARGYAVVATDYAGLGSPGPHPYLVGDASAFAVLDSVRAAREFRPDAFSGRYVVWGESQGAHAALWTGQSAVRYAPELRLLGVAAAAPPTDLVANLTGGTNPLIRALLTAYTTTSWSQVYGIPMSTILKPVGANVARRLASNCVSTDPVKLRTKIGLFRLTQALRDVDIGKSPPWAAQLRRNSVQPGGFSSPVLIAQGSADPVVAPAVTRDFTQRLCRRGAARVRYLAIEGGDHFSIGKRSAAATVAWIADRFAGRAAPSDCGRI